ncbi:MAG: LytTR family DNA-binding domain-containing protein [Bacillota bacterium]|nr:LytTR family DNA-binding domain-containing protein [Bacillota bacterium]
MKFTVEEIPRKQEEELIFRCHEMNDETLETIRRIKSVTVSQDGLIGYEKEKIYKVPPGSIFYVESVDNHVFLYTENRCFESRLKLYEIEEKLKETKFFRASKSLILNLAKIAYVSPAMNGRFEAVLTNGEKQIVTRQYVPELKKRLGM